MKVVLDLPETAVVAPDQSKDSQESVDSPTPFQTSQHISDIKESHQQVFDRFTTDNYGEMCAIKVGLEKNDFRFLFNSQGSRSFFGICMFLMNAVLMKRKAVKDFEEVTHFYPVVSMKFVEHNRQIGLNSIHTIALGSGYSQKDWIDQSSFVFNFLSNNSYLEHFKPPSIFNFVDNSFVQELKKSEFKVTIHPSIFPSIGIFLHL